MEKDFQISVIGELNFFLGIQVKQMRQGEGPNTRDQREVNKKQLKFSTRTRPIYQNRPTRLSYNSINTT
jgi:hypothetical protein